MRSISPIVRNRVSRREKNARAESIPDRAIEIIEHKVNRHTCNCMIIIHDSYWKIVYYLNTTHIVKKMLRDKARCKAVPLSVY